MKFDYNDKNRVDIKVHKGRDFEFKATTTYDITGYAYTGGIYERDDLTSVIAFTPTVDEANKKVYMRLTDNQTAGLASGTRYIYDIKERNSSGFDKQWVWGYVTIYDTGTP